ncbi:hypothetical protein W97_01450 [Coniosporium apollinis CBS 100218]|uniref:Uncharacterized protein n=1 Tax=Coniosporium apollinis (strain CBS 100218) TaxID=1168221 RepID=R7YK97_CONA1|nr:uncharacterized protein W97_01450 [Coniosporium apollinis CBS 100218]EON62229.1 hypothetical protein W97_01450 [Coniosporium apollinis CBS 100218]
MSGRPSRYSAKLSAVGGRCRLLELPRELRDIIYEYGLSDPAGLEYISPPCPSYAPNYWPLKARAPIGTGILRTCKQIYHEAHLTPLRKNAVHVHIDKDDPEGHNGLCEASSFFTAIGPTRLREIRDVIIYDSMTAPVGDDRAFTISEFCCREAYRSHFEALIKTMNVHTRMRVRMVIFFDGYGIEEWERLGSATPFWASIVGKAIRFPKILSFEFRFAWEAMPTRHRISFHAFHHRFNQLFTEEALFSQLFGEEALSSNIDSRWARISRALAQWTLRLSDYTDAMPDRRSHPFFEMMGMLGKVKHIRQEELPDWWRQSEQPDIEPQRIGIGIGLNILGLVGEVTAALLLLELAVVWPLIALKKLDAVPLDFEGLGWTLYLWRNFSDWEVKALWNERGRRLAAEKSQALLFHFFTLGILSTLSALSFVMPT